MREIKYLSDAEVKLEVESMKRARIMVWLVAIFTVFFACVALLPRMGKAVDQELGIYKKHSPSRMAGQGE